MSVASDKAAQHSLVGMHPVFEKDGLPTGWQTCLLQRLLVSFRPIMPGFTLPEYPASRSSYLLLHAAP